MAETVSFRPDPWSESNKNSFAGFSPCYTAREPGKPWLEGLNHRVDNCPGDYSYNKVHQHAYIITGDRRFTDFFSQGADTVMRLYRDPKKGRAEEWFELSASRTVYQYFEQLLNAAEFNRIGGDEKNRKYRDAAIGYFDYMKKNALDRGYTCNMLGTGIDEPRVKGGCFSDQAWMLPVWIDWVARLYRLYDHVPAKAWIADYVKMSQKQYMHTNPGSSPGGSGSWHTAYVCKATKAGIQDDTCKPANDVIENGARFYANGVVAYLNTYGIALDVDPSDPAKICDWLPGAYESAISGMRDLTNDYVWGKELGQAFGMTQSALGALERCK